MQPAHHLLHPACCCLPCSLLCPASARPACCAAMASLHVLAFDHEGRPIQFDTWLNDLQLYLLSDSKDSVSLFDHRSCSAPAPPATADSATRSPWLTRDTSPRLAIHNHLLLAECAHFGQHRTAQALYDAVVARYSSPATAALGRLLLPYPFPELSAFATVEDLVLLVAFLARPSLRGVPPPPLPLPTPLLLLLTSLVLRMSGLLLLVGSAATARARMAGVVAVAAAVVVGAAVEVVEAVEVVAVVGVVAGVEALVEAVVAAVGVAVVAAVGVVVVGLELLSGEVLAVARGSSTSVRAGPRSPSSFYRCFSRLDDAWGTEFGDEAELPRWAELLRMQDAIFDLDFDAILAAMYGLSFSAEGDSYRCVPPNPGLHLPSFSTNLPGSSLYTLATEPPQVAASAQVSASGQLAPPCLCRLLSHQTLLWHHRLRHPSVPRLRGMHSRLLVSGLPRSLPPLPPSPAPPCLPCVEGWQRAAPHSSLFPPTTAPLQTLHKDLWGPSHVSGQGRERYFLLVVDDYTRYTMVFPLRSKGEVPDVLIPWICAVRLQLRERFRQDLPVLRLHSDRGGEFSDLLRDFCHGEGILQSFTLPASPQQNGIAERRFGLVMEVARTSMIHAAAPHFLWPFAVRYAAHHLNLWPRVSLPETSPTLRWTGNVDDALVLRVWVSRAFVHNTSADKLSTHAIPCVVLGFPPNTPGAAAAGPGGARTRGTGAAGTGGVGGAGAGDPTEPGAAGAGGARAGGTSAGGVGAVGARAGGIGAGGARAGGAGAVDPEVRGAGGTLWPQRRSRRYSLPPHCLLLLLTERREPASRPASPVRAGHRVPRPRPSLVFGTHVMALRPSSVPLRVPLPPPPESSLPAVPDPESGRARAASPTVSRLLATVVTDPSFVSTAASALVARLLYFAVAFRLDYANVLVVESESATPPSVGGECALGTDVLEDRQEDFECLAAAVPHFASMLLAPEGDPDAPDIPTPCSFAEAITSPYSTHRVKQAPGSPPAFKARYVARRDYESHSLDFSTAFLQGSVHEEIGLRRPLGFTGTTLAALGFTPSTADLSLFLRIDTSLPPFYVLITWDRAWHTITLTQAHMVHQVLQRFGFQFCSPQPAPLSTGHLLSAPPSDESVEPSGPHLEIVGCLITLGMGLVLGGWGLVVLTGHADASWVDDSATLRTSKGYTFSLSSGSISWRCTCSSSVLSSSCEAKIYVGARAAQGLRWLTYLLTDLGEQPRLPPQRGQLRLAYVAIRANTADIFTKALPPGDHQRFSTMLGLVPTLPHLLTLWLACTVI
ncbi:unnamed protein product [Closterium sp. NIES-53]